MLQCLLPLPLHWATFSSTSGSLSSWGRAYGLPTPVTQAASWPRGQAKQGLFPVTLCSSISCQTVLSRILTCWEELIITEGTGGGVELLLMTRRDSGVSANDGHDTVLTWTPMSHPQPPCLEVPAPQVQLGLTSTSWLSSISLGTEICPPPRNTQGLCFNSSPMLPTLNPTHQLTPLLARPLLWTPNVKRVSLDLPPPLGCLSKSQMKHNCFLASLSSVTDQRTAL